MDRPETRFAWRGDVALAYQTLGDGSPPLLYLQGWPSNVELNWDHPKMARFLRGLGRSRKLVVMDTRGTGCSERGTPGDVWPLETIMEDAIAVLDAAEVDSSQGRITLAVPKLTGQPLLDSFYQSWVYAAVNAIAQEVARQRPFLFVNTGQADHEQTPLPHTHPLARLLDYPNPWTTPWELW